MNFTVPDSRQLGEGGLLGMALDSTLSTNNYLYIVYCYYLDEQPEIVENYREKLVRYTYDGVNNTLINPFILLTNIKAWSTHNGSRIQFGSDGKIYMTTGDVQDLPSAQNDNALTGKILRINPDGSIPADNPISGNYMWSKGHRNPQGLVFANGILYSSEHGPNNNDEMNIIEKGRNYGWPNVHGYCQDNTAEAPDEAAFCAANNVKEPIAAWSPTIATSGIEFYNNDAIAPDGRVFICTDNSSNSIIEITGFN